MDSETIQIEMLNNPNITCSASLLRTQKAAGIQKAQLYVCIVALLLHTIFWLQLPFSSFIRQKSLQWIYAYLITDILLLCRFFLDYIAYTIFAECRLDESWALFVCYAEATVDNCLNMLEVYILLALNICRYIQIVYKRNVYIHHLRLLIMIHFGIYVLPFLVIFIQFLTGWALIEQLTGDLCNARYVNIYIQIFNIIIAFALPVLLNVVVIYLSARYIRLTSTLQGGHHHMTAHEKYNRSLVIQFLVFYTVWIVLWSPNIIVYHFITGANNITSIVRLLNFIDIALDPIIVGALDVRFWQAWRKLCLHLRNTCLRTVQRQQRQVRPMVAQIAVERMQKPNEMTL